jgi:hypothetical protein
MDLQIKRQKLVLGITPELAPFYLNSTFNLSFTASLTFNYSKIAKMIRFKIKDNILNHSTGVVACYLQAVNLLICE